MLDTAAGVELCFGEILAFALIGDTLIRRVTILQQVQDALRRIEDGTYGQCLIDGGPIDPKRLEDACVDTLLHQAPEATGGRFETEANALAERVMTQPFISRGFRGRRQPGSIAERLPPGQYETRDFPVLSAGPTPHTPLATWDFSLSASNGATARWNWKEFGALAHESIKTDIHCVTKWSKLDTEWEGVSVDTLLAEAASRGVERAPYVLAVCDGGYTTNLPLADVTGGKAWVAVTYAGAPLAPEHGGPARLLVPHLYFWKSAKWLRALTFMQHDRPGFWESFGYHNYGDPWREQRYSGDE